MNQLLVIARIEKKLPKELVRELFNTYGEIKRNFFLGNLRPSEVEGGLFAEAVFRILEFETKNKYTKLGAHINKFAEQCIDMQKLPAIKYNESIRIHIPRTIMLLYYIRSKRDVVHLADGIDPNLQDSSFVANNADWVMAEIIRLYNDVSPNEAHRIIDTLISRKLPIVQDFDGFLKTLNPRLKVSERILVLLYQKVEAGSSEDELSSWLKPDHRPNLKRTLRDMEYEKDLIVYLNNDYKITKRGIKLVEDLHLLDDNN
ncbi:MAG: hypothetical protein Q7S21_05315 [archaeon]|nr:hypothetical protein [archaeon]